MYNQGLPDNLGREMLKQCVRVRTKYTKKWPTKKQKIQKTRNIIRPTKCKKISKDIAPIKQ